MPAPLPATHQRLAIEAELADGPCRFVRERLRLPMGVEASFGWLRHPPSVLVVPREPDGHLLLVRRWRPALGRWVLEFPAGRLEPGESPAAAAARLLRRLTGQGGGTWSPLGQLRPNPGYSDELMTLGWMALEGEAGEVSAEGPSGALGDAGSLQLRRYTPLALEAALSSLEEPGDGRSVSAWFLARRLGCV